MSLMVHQQQTNFSIDHPKEAVMIELIKIPFRPLALATGWEIDICYLVLSQGITKARL